MSGWTASTLAEVADIGAGNSAPQDERLFKDGVHPFIRTSDVGKIRFGSISTSADLLNEEGVEGLRRFPKGTILMPKSGASTFLNHRVEMAGDGYVSSHLATVHARPKLCEGKFLLYYLSTVRAQDLIQDHKYPSLTLGTIGEIPVPLPSLEEQKRIVAVLDKAFAALDRARTNAKANLDSASCLLRQGLDREFSAIAEVAPSLPLQDAVHPKCGLSYGIVQPGDEEEAGLPIVRPVDLGQREVGLTGLKRISPDAASGYVRTTLRGGELLLCVRGSTGTVAVAAQELAGANVTRGIVPIRFDERRVLHDFAYFQFSASAIQDQIAEKTYGAALMQINIKDLRGLRFLVPEIHVQSRIVSRLEDLVVSAEAVKRSYQDQLTNIAALRQSLLRAAFSGQLT